MQPPQRKHAYDFDFGNLELMPPEVTHEDIDALFGVIVRFLLWVPVSDIHS